MSGYGPFFWWEWLAFATGHLWTSRSYVSLRTKLMGAAKDDQRATISTANMRLFWRFIMACGVGHVLTIGMKLLMAAFMEEYAPGWCDALRDNRPAWMWLAINSAMIWHIGTGYVSDDARRNLRVSAD